MQPTLGDQIARKIESIRAEFEAMPASQTEAVQDIIAALTSGEAELVVMSKSSGARWAQLQNAVQVLRDRNA